MLLFAGQTQTPEWAFGVSNTEGISHDNLSDLQLRREWSNFFDQAAIELSSFYDIISIMNYEIRCSKGKDSVVGIEIAPPLRDIAAGGLARAMTFTKTTVDRVAITDALVVRQDDEGTALSVNLEARVDPVDVAIIAQILMDPADIHSIRVIQHS